MEHQRVSVRTRVRGHLTRCFLHIHHLRFRFNHELNIQRLRRRSARSPCCVPTLNPLAITRMLYFPGGSASERILAFVVGGRALLRPGAAELHQGAWHKGAGRIRNGAMKARGRGLRLCGGKIRHKECTNARLSFHIGQSFFI